MNVQKIKAILEIMRKHASNGVQSKTLLTETGEHDKDPANINKRLIDLYDSGIVGMSLEKDSITKEKKTRANLYRLSQKTKIASKNYQTVIKKSKFTHMVAALFHSLKKEDARSEKSEVIDDFYTLCNLSVTSFNKKVEVFERVNESVKNGKIINEIYDDLSQYKYKDIDIMHTSEELKSYYGDHWWHSYFVVNLLIIDSSVHLLVYDYYSNPKGNLWAMNTTDLKIRYTQKVNQPSFDKSNINNGDINDYLEPNKKSQEI